MAHNLNFNEQTGQFSFYTVREKAWHNLGHVSDQYENSSEVLKKAQLDYLVEKQPMIYTFPSGKVLVSDEDFYTFRTDTEQILGKGLKADYTVVQNVEAFAFFDAIAKDEGILYETAGALGNGERVFITAKLPSYIKVGNDDIIENYLFLTLSHDGKSCLIGALTPTRIVCNNTLNIALQNCTNMVKIRHTPNVQDQLKEAHKVMGMVNTLTPLLEQAFNNWAKVKITDKQVYRLIQMAMAPDKETLHNIKEGKEELNSGKYNNMVLGAMGYAQVAESQQLDTTKGTLFGAFNAITGYFQNVRDYPTPEAKIDSVIYGGFAQKKAQATVQICTDFAKIGENALFMN
jgi:phage/plasmid-like protein (TIGR03299 family)